MRLVDIVKRAGSSLKQAKLRTLFTSLAIGVGAFTLTLAMAAGEGTRQYGQSLIGENIHPRFIIIAADEGAFSTEPQVGIRDYDPKVSSIDGFTFETMDQQDIDKLSEREDLERVVPVYQLSAKHVTFEGSDKKFIADISAYEDTVNNSKVIAGNLPKLGEQIESDEVVVPEEFVEFLKEQKVIESGEDLIGKRIVLTVASGSESPESANEEQVILTVRALVKKSAAALNGANSLLISNQTAQKISEITTEGTPMYQRYVGVTALVKEGKDPIKVKESINELGFNAQVAKDLQDLLFTIVNVLQGIVIGFSLLAVIASVFGIINTQYISVLERTQQIGLMKALGMRGRHVRRLFQFEAAWIGAFGGAIGSLLALLVGTLLNPWISDKLGIGEDRYLLIFQGWVILAIIVALSLIAMIAGLLPANKAAKLDPIEALRTE